MFKNRARNVRARRVDSSSDNSSEGEEELRGELAGRPRALRGGRGLSCSSRVPRAASPGGGASPRAHGGEAKSGLLSFNPHREADGEQFKIKKPSFSEVLFKVQKKGITASPDRQNETSKDIPPPEETTNSNFKDLCEVEDGGQSPGSEGSQSSTSASQSSSSQSSSSQSSSSQSSSSQEKGRTDADAIPDAHCILEARRKRQLARAQGEYIALDASGGKPKERRDTDRDDEPDDHEQRISFTPKSKTLKQRMADKLEPNLNKGSDESEEENIQDKWEEQQIRKAVRHPQNNDIGDYSPRMAHVVKKKFKPPLSRPPVNLEDMKRQLSARLTSFQEVHRSHQREYERFVCDIESSKNTIQKLETAPNAALQYTFYKSMKTYVENLEDCLNEKISQINELEAALHQLLHEKAKTLLERRQEDLRNESATIQRLGKPATTSDAHLVEGEKSQRLLEECMSRRAVRKQRRETLGKNDHHDGMSSDDEMPPAKIDDFQKEKDTILKESKQIFADVHKDFCSIRNVLTKFQEWREKFPDSYYEAYISLCLPKLLNPLIRIQLIAWNPLESCADVEQMPWYRTVKHFGVSKRDAETKEDYRLDDDILPKITEKIVIPKITDFVEHVWDPLSSTQTDNLVELCKTVLVEYEPNKAKQDLMNLVVSRIKKAIEDDVYIPLYSKSAVEDNQSPHAVFQERQFWTAVKLLRNVLYWDGLVDEQTLQELGLEKLLNRYLILMLLNAQPGPHSLGKFSKIVACLPDRWFKGLNSGSTLPQLANFSKHLLQSAHTMHKNNYRDEMGEVTLLLAKIKALNSAEVLIKEYNLEHLNMLIKK